MKPGPAGSSRKPWASRRKMRALRSGSNKGPVRGSAEIDKGNLEAELPFVLGLRVGLRRDKNLVGRDGQAELVLIPEHFLLDVVAFLENGFGRDELIQDKVIDLEDDLLVGQGILVDAAPDDEESVAARVVDQAVLPA